MNVENLGQVRVDLGVETLRCHITSTKFVVGGGSRGVVVGHVRQQSDDYFGFVSLFVKDSNDLYQKLDRRL